MSAFTTEWTGAPGARFNKEEICEMFGLTKYALNDLLTRGADIAVVRVGSKSVDWQIDTAIFLDWFLRFKCDPDFKNNADAVRKYVHAVRANHDNA